MTEAKTCMEKQTILGAMFVKGQKHMHCLSTFPLTDDKLFDNVCDKF